MRKLLLSMMLVAIPSFIFAQFKLKSDGCALIGSNS